MDRKFVFLVNPISGTKSKQQLPDLIREAAKKYNAWHEILPTVASGDYQFVREKIAEENITDIIMCGGDGTVNTVVQQLYDLDVNFGIVPLGSGNGLALCAKIPPQAEKALDIVFTGKAAYIDAFKVNDSFACMLCGLGFDAQVAHDFSKQAGRGLITYAKQSIIEFIRSRPYTFEIKLNDSLLNTDAYFISIANSNQFGNQVTIAPSASLNDGLLDIVVVRKMSKVALPVSLLLQIAGNNAVSSEDRLTKTNVWYFQAAELTIENPGEAPLHIDGEPRETMSTLHFRVIPNCFRLIQPA
ncbi:MAG: YegS/Rv2252/BmrU family lipid kinase [Gemmatimonadaceae bacterium]|nr:YegS/Rv2252/BmrU family lipid kinase [Chitinophagaceae bacterium]